MSDPTSASPPLPTVRLADDLRGRLVGLARGRAVVIGHFASHRCGAVIGDLTVELRDRLSDDAYVELDPLDGVPVLVERALLPVLKVAGPSLRLGGPPFARHLAVGLDRPEVWLEFLERPGSTRRPVTSSGH